LQNKLAKEQQLAIKTKKTEMIQQIIPAPQIINIQQNINIDYKNIIINDKNIIINDRGNYLLGDVEIKSNEISMLDPRKINLEGVLQNIYNKFPILHYPRRMEDFSHITDQKKFKSLVFHLMMQWNNHSI
jgi:hypothetical protein